MKLKPEYVPMLNLWQVRGYGYFSTYDEAIKKVGSVQEEREANNKTEQIKVSLTKDMMNELVRLSDKRGIKPVELIRLLIEKEMNENG